MALRRALHPGRGNVGSEERQACHGFASVLREDRVEERRHRVGEFVLPGEATREGVGEIGHTMFDAVDPFVHQVRRRAGRRSGQVIAALGTYLFDQTDQRVTAPAQIGSGLPACELGLLTGDLGMGCNRCELRVNSIFQLPDFSAELFDGAQEPGNCFVAENPAFPQRMLCFSTAEHQTLLHSLWRRGCSEHLYWMSSASGVVILNFRFSWKYSSIILKCSHSAAEGFIAQPGACLTVR